jgi:hypothetical protein
MENRRLIHRHYQQERAYDLQLSLPYFYLPQLENLNGKKWSQVRVFSGCRWR